MGSVLKLNIEITVFFSQSLRIWGNIASTYVLLIKYLHFGFKLDFLLKSNKMYASVLTVKMSIRQSGLFCESAVILENQC